MGAQKNNAEVRKEQFGRLRLIMVSYEDIEERNQ